MKTRGLDKNHDWLLGKGLSDYVADAGAISQNIQTRILSWKGDCYFALQDGVDWTNRLGVGQQKALLEEIRALLLQTEGVVSVNNVTASYVPEKRSYTLSYDIQTIFSPSFQAEVDLSAGGVVI